MKKIYVGKMVMASKIKVSVCLMAALLAVEISQAQKLKETYLSDTPETRAFIEQVNQACGNGKSSDVDAEKFQCSKGADPAALSQLLDISKNQLRDATEFAKRDAALQVCFKPGATTAQVQSCVNKKGTQKDGTLTSNASSFLGAFAGFDFVNTAARMAGVTASAGRGGRGGSATSGPTTTFKVARGADDKRTSGGLRIQGYRGDKEAEDSCPANKYNDPKDGAAYDPVVLTQDSTDCVECAKARGSNTGAVLGSSDIQKLAASATGSSRELSSEQVKLAYKKAVPKLEAETTHHYVTLVGERMLADIYLYEGADGVSRRLPEIQSAMSCLSKDSKETLQQLTAQLPKVARDEVAKKRNDYVAHMVFASQCREAVQTRLQSLKQDLGDLDPQEMIFSLSEKAKGQNSVVRAIATSGEFVIGMAPLLGQAYSRVAMTPKMPGMKRKCDRTLRNVAPGVIKGDAAVACDDMVAEAAILSTELEALDRTYPVLVTKKEGGERVAQTLNRKVAQIDPSFAARVTGYSQNPSQPSDVVSCMDRFKEDPKNAQSALISPPSGAFQEALTIADLESVNRGIKRLKEEVQEVCKDKEAAIHASLSNPAFLESFYSCDRPQFSSLAALGIETSVAQPKDSKSCSDRKSSPWVACSMDFDKASGDRGKTAAMTMVGEGMSTGFMFAGLGAPSLAGGTKAVLSRLAWGGVINTAFSAAMMAPMASPSTLKALEAQKLVDFRVGLASTDAYESAVDTIKTIPGWGEVAASSFAMGMVGGLFIDLSGPSLSAKIPGVQNFKARFPELANEVKQAAYKVPKGTRSLMMQAFGELQGKAKLNPAQEARIYDFLAGNLKKLPAEDIAVLKSLEPQVKRLMTEFQEDLGKIIAKLEEEKKFEGLTGQKKRDAIYKEVNRMLVEKDPKLLEVSGAFPTEKGEFLQLISIMEKQCAGKSKVSMNSMIGFFRKVSSACAKGEFGGVPLPACGT